MDAGQAGQALNELEGRGLAAKSRNGRWSPTDGAREAGAAEKRVWVPRRPSQLTGRPSKPTGSSRTTKVTSCPQAPAAPISRSLLRSHPSCSTRPNRPTDPGRLRFRRPSRQEFGASSQLPGCAEGRPNPKGGSNWRTSSMRPATGSIPRTFELNSVRYKNRSLFDNPHCRGKSPATNVPTVAELPAPLRLGPCGNRGCSQSQPAQS